MNPVPDGAIEPAPTEAAGPAPSDAVFEASPEESEPTQATMLNTAPARSVTLGRPALKNFVPAVGGFTPYFPHISKQATNPLSRLSITPLRVSRQASQPR